ncbi:MAG: ABC transporter substrate-binding protein [Actinomycetota bacterium]|nr:ABC transporter substrate-binding protein [Actinomycetota bacterium]
MGAMGIDRRAFVLGGLGAAGAVMLGACGSTRTQTSSGGGGCPINQPCARPTIRQDSGVGSGFPSPFAYQFGAAGYYNVVLLYDTLLWTDQTGKFLPWLASSYTTSPDGLTWTFQLRNNVTWSDGQPFTADDVVFTFEYYAAHAATLAAATIGVPPIPVQARASDPHTVVVQLSSPIATFGWDVAATLPMTPRHVWSGISDPRKAQDPKLLVGTGPYRLASFSTAENTALFTARDDYFLGRPFVARIPTAPVTDQLQALLANQIDVGGTSPGGVRPDALQPFRSDPSYGVQQAPTSFTTTLRWNLAKGGALADVRFRQACAMAVDTKSMVSRLLGGQGTVGNAGFINPADPYYTPVPQYAFDPAAARRLLDQAGYPMGSGGVRHGPDGKPLSFELVVTSQSPAAGELVISYLSAIGVHLTPKLTDVLTYFSVIPKGNYEMAVGFDGGNVGDPDLLRQHFSSTVAPSNFNTSGSGYVNPTLDSLCQQQLTTLDPGARRPLINQIQQIVAHDLPILALFYPNTYTVWRRSVYDQWANVPSNVDGGATYNSDKHSFIFGVKTGLTGRPAR